MSLIPKIGLPKGSAGSFLVDGVADGYEAIAIAQAASEIAPDGPLVFVARDGQRPAGHRGGARLRRARSAGAGPAGLGLPAL